MSKQQAVDLVLEAATRSVGGEIFVTKMPVARISDLAQVVIELLAPGLGLDAASVEQREIGARVGEKIYEELMTDDESPRARELPNHFVILPAALTAEDKKSYRYAEEQASAEINCYRSDQEAPMSREDVRRYLESHRILDDME